MVDPVLFCALAYATFLEFADLFSTPAFYEQNVDAAMYVSEMAGDITDRLMACGRYEREIALLARIGRQAAGQAHKLEDQAAHTGTPLRQYDSR